MGFLSAAGALASSVLGSVGSGLSYASPVLGSIGSIASSGNFGGWLDFSSGQSKLKDAYRRALNAEEYTARNSPSWTVDGLRRAGLNPILALQDGSVTAAHGVNPTMSQGAGDVSFSLKKRTDKENELLEEQAKSASATASNLEANSAKVRNEIKNDNLRTASEVELNSARQRNIDVDTANKFDTGGLGGTAGLVSGIANRVVGEGINKKINPYAKYLEHAAKDKPAGSTVVEKLEKMASPLSNSAKDYKAGKDKLRREGYILHMR